MPQINLEIRPNEYFTTNPESILTNLLEKYNVSNLFYGYIFLGYPNWHAENIDLFQYLPIDFLDNLRHSNTLLIVDYTFEGFSHTECPIINILEKNCVQYNINPKKIFYFSGNLKDKSDLINVIPIFLLDNNNNFKNLHSDIDVIQKTFLNKKQNEILLSLSRRNRFHRVIAHAMLFSSGLKEYSVISQDVLTDINANENLLRTIGLSPKQWKRFTKNLPLIADENNFHINDPFNHLFDLHAKTCFSIVNETLINDWNDTSLFFSEKILKPIINFQPFVIYGQPGINHAMIDLGFQLYDKYFDLSFDYEKNNTLRYKKLLDSIEKTVHKLANLDVTEQMNWRFQHLEILKNNYNNFLLQTHSNQAGRKFSNIISKL
jgi:hypothetical protein